MMQGLLRKVTAFFSSSPSDPRASARRVVLSRKEHGISRKQIDKAALDVLYGLKKSGFEAYLVGGCVRDLLLGIEPKDFDVVTNAKPEQIKAVFKHRCRLIGRRFRLAHVRFGRLVIEVATFRGDGETSEGNTQTHRAVDANGRLIRDNVFGTLEEDVWRRDFTVNSLYYNIKDFSIIDYTGGMADLKKGQLKLIGDPETRYREDPVRMIRAVRFAAKLGFEIEARTKAPIYELGHLMKDVSHARLFEEVLKLFHSGVGVEVFEKLRHFGLFTFLFPQTHHVLSQEDQGFPRMLVVEALKSTDARINSEKGVNPAFLFAAMLWEPMLMRREQHLAEGFAPQDATFAAAGDVIEMQNVSTMIPKRFMSQIKEIWNLQFRLPSRSGARAQKLFEHPRFRAAYDFMGIRAAAGDSSVENVFHWWTEFQEKDPIAQVAFANKIKSPQKRSRRPRRGRNPYRQNKESNSNAPNEHSSVGGE